jgi:leader peptidase (prepilin peptidase) / N-methyltransferase
MGARLALFAVLGLCFGSFLTVAVYRLPRRESVVAPRSACPRCGTTIAARDNVPVVSYLLLRGRCRTCHTPISAEYPIVEALTGALFVGAALAHRGVGVAAVLAPFLGVMVAAALIDARHRIIPNSLVLPSLILFGAVLGAVGLLEGGVDLLRGFLGLLAYGGGLMLVALISPGGMGMGDVKLAALIGLVLGALGWGYLEVAALGAVLGGGIGAVAVLARGGRRKDTMPFGPYLAGAAVVAGLFGAQISAWYAGLFR